MVFFHPLPNFRDTQNNYCLSVLRRLSTVIFEFQVFHGGFTIDLLHAQAEAQPKHCTRVKAAATEALTSGQC